MGGGRKNERSVRRARDAMGEMGERSEMSEMSEEPGGVVAVCVGGRSGSEDEGEGDAGWMAHDSRHFR